ncbi:trafficking kinesin-binding protein 2 isoform X2 [Vombatus ursinus]|uniref:Trafficking kinesin protein 2 n=1 Tax=Vombatus ursinus TaxID=29139 RepID=A0A4X2KH93_VOMUR|nr:trafficking kinesin-binding protein 2 isoform X2 [Vombatus ursinus]
MTLPWNAISDSLTHEENLMNSNHRDSESITDVCSNEDLPEVELVSLLEEQLPQYKLRVDSLLLYENQDWTQSPHQNQHDSKAISPVLAEETFRYMILGTDRVEQMTRTYNDIDMVTHLLAERDRDLELAARIGQALLKRNHVLSEQNEALEEQLGQAFDQVNQLQHELSKKEALLRVSFALEESETDSSCSTPLRFNESFSLSQGLLQLDMLQEKLKELEEENLALRSKASHIKTETITYEEKEQQLVNDCVKELRETNAQMSRMTEELSGKSDELIQYQEKISSLLSQILDLQHKIKEHVIEKEELRLHLQASKDAQRQLTMELHELQDRNAECLGMLHESQEEVKELRSRSGPAAHLYVPQQCGVLSAESLAAEIEGTMRKELSLDEESSLCKQKEQQKRVFDTVKVANDTRCRSASFPALLPIPGSNRSSVIMTAKLFQSGLPRLESRTHPNPRSSMEDLSEDSQNMRLPGTPGDSDLATALHRLCLRRQNYLSEKQFFAEEWERKMRVLTDEKEETSGCSTPTGSFASLCTNQSEVTDLSTSTSCLRAFMPEKLQIVKPLKGSQTLHHWQQLAQPNLGTILDPRPGVITKGFTLLPEDAIYHLSDLEEDEDGGITFQVQQSFQEEGKSSVSKPVPSIFLPPLTSASVPLTASNPGKCLSSTNSTFTFTTCRILHPSDITQVTPSSNFPSLSCGSTGSSTPSTAMNSPALSYRLNIGESISSRRDYTTTCSSTRGLAKLLQERGISAKVYHSPISENPLILPATKVPAIPSTPPNTPYHSPCPSPLPFEPRAYLSENFLASRPAETFLQEVYGLRPSKNLPDIGQSKMNLVDRLKRLGIARVIQPPEMKENGKSQGTEIGLRRPDSATFLNASSNLLGGLRRNQSLPVMMGGFGAPVCTSSPKMAILKED